MCLSFWRQMFSRLVMWVASNWGKRTAWAMCCSLLFHSFLYSFPSFPPSFLPWAVLWAGAWQITSAAAGKPLGHLSWSSSAIYQSTGGGSGRALNSSQLSSTPSSLMMLSIFTCDTSWRLGLMLMLTGSASSQTASVWLKVVILTPNPFSWLFLHNMVFSCSDSSVMWFHMKEITEWAKLWVKINNL